MSDTISLANIRTELIYDAAIDGQSTSTGRHSSDRLNSLINRGYAKLRSVAAQNGAPFFRLETTPATIPAQLSGEDYIPLVWPTDAAEITSVEVRISGAWFKLTKLERGQARTASVYPNFACGAMGEWAEWVLPQPDTAGDPTDVTAGVIAAWPVTLSGTYKISYLPHWVDITTDGHVFVMYPDWLDWLLSWCVMRVVKRDNNKRGTYQAARDDFDQAHARVVAHSRRFLRGSRRAMRRDGMSL